MSEGGAMFKRSIAVSLPISCCALAVAAWCHGAAAEGAVALGVTGNITKDGYAIGININAGSEAEARDAALKYCQSHGSAVARAKCEIFATFSNQCAAEAEDPQPGTRRGGLALARGSFCKVVTAVSDGK